MRSEKSILCDRIREYANTDEKSKDRIDDFLQVNSLSKLEDCSDMETLELIFKIETFMSAEKELTK